jgi:steroid delta-isomerase-like uncharacterized protein
VADDCVAESPVHGKLKGRERIADVYRNWFSAFPDVRFEATDVVAEDERAVMFWTVTGTHTAEFSGFPPTGRTFQIRGASLYTFSDGRIVHERRLYDFTSLLMQIGVLKAKPAP